MATRPTRTVTHLAVGVDDAVGLLGGEILEIGALVRVRHWGRGVPDGMGEGQGTGRTRIGPSRAAGGKIRVRAEGGRASRGPQQFEGLPRACRGACSGACPPPFVDSLGKWGRSAAEEREDGLLCDGQLGRWCRGALG